MTATAELTLTALVAHIRDGDVSAEQATRSCLERIERWNPILNAFVAVDADPPVAQARAAEAARRAGETLPP
ncbi:amidase, partial [Methylopila musalis]